MDPLSFLVTSQAVYKLIAGLRAIDWSAAAKTAAKDVADTDWDEVTATAARKAADPTEVQKQLDLARSALAKLDTDAKALDPDLQDPAMRIVDANRQWLQAEQENLEATPSEAEQAAAKASALKERAEREAASFELLKGMHDATKASAEALGEIKAARVLANQQATDQSKFNKKMAWSALLIAIGSLLASVVMPTIQEFWWPGPAAPNVVVITESNLTVPPLLRRPFP